MKSPPRQPPPSILAKAEHFHQLGQLSMMYTVPGNSPILHPFLPPQGVTGSGLPLQIWARLMRDVKKYRPDLLAGNFETPLGVRELTVDPKHSLLVRLGLKNILWWVGGCRFVDRNKVPPANGNSG